MMEWINDYSVSNQEIDEQHKVLIDLLNQIERIIQKEEFNYLNLVITVEELHKYLKGHFDHEEKLMLLYEYPDIMSHTHAHNLFRDKLLNTYVLEIEKPKEFFYEMSEYLTHWLREHILKVDMKLGIFLKDIEQ
jgi:hemerythrin-like metal-binding protein